MQLDRRFDCAVLGIKMLSPKLPLARIVHCGRPLRLPNPSKDLPKPRLFSQNSQLLLISGATPRPQLPFLHPATGGRSLPIGPRSQLQYQLARLLTTERKVYLKHQVRLGVKYTLYGWAALFLITVMAWGLQLEIAERKFPAPKEWTWKSRAKYHLSKTQEHTDATGFGVIDWTNVGLTYLELIERLENPDIDGQDLLPIWQEAGNIYVDGVGKAGLDISKKSEAWRRGYHEALMGVAKAAENREGWVIDRTRAASFPPEIVIGPSNPHPKPVPYEAPLEENCSPAFQPPETVYMKILTTNGFNSRQRLEAALAYADWLDFKGLSSTAGEMFHWGLDIALGSLPAGVNNVVDIKTGVINSKATYVSSNVLRATTALAEHHARNNNLAAALPIFLSVLRARRQLPDAPPEPRPTAENQTIFSLVQSFLAGPTFPVEPPTGDEIPSRTPAAICEEAGVMSHIGELLFATAGRLAPKQSGMSWTRDAVDLAEATINSIDDKDNEAREKCTECLAVSMENWSKMIEKMRKEERQAKSGTQQKSSGSWFWNPNAATDAVEEGKWEREAKIVHERLRSVRRLIINEEDRKQAQRSNLFA